MEKWSKTILCMLTFVVCILTGTNADATFFTGSATGMWGNVVSTDPNDVYSIRNRDHRRNNVARFNWGEGGSYPATRFDNQLTFNGIGSGPREADWAADEDFAFLLGDFTYRNGSTYNSAGVDGVDLDIAIALSTPESIGFTFTNSFSITNTPNTGTPAENADIVTLSGTTGNTFTYAGTEYVLDLLGFSTDSGNTFVTEFSSLEGATANVGLYGKIRKSGGAQVPEPATIFLLGSGLLGMFGFRKKYRRSTR